MTFDISITAEHPIRNVIPPRCRKARTVYQTIQTVVEVPEAASDEAPVAMEYMNPISGLQQRRWHDGRLYRPYLPHARQKEPSLPGSVYFPDERSFGAHELASVDGATEAHGWVEERFDAYLIVDGQVWVEAGELVYVVMTFGLGHNHGGTGLMVDEIYGDATNSNIKRSAYWSAHQFNEAHAQAVEVATRRGDTESIPRFDDRTHGIRVLIDEAVRFTHRDSDR